MFADDLNGYRKSAEVSIVTVGPFLLSLNRPINWSAISLPMNTIEASVEHGVCER
jgi:hypothetical protein